MFKSLYQKMRARVAKWLIYEPPATQVMPYDFNRLKYEIRPGDVLLIEGRSRVSRIIRSITQSPWTHAAIYIGRLSDIEDPELQTLLRNYTHFKENTRLIIEDLLDKGTIVSPLFSYRNHHIRICRAIGITPTDIDQVIHYVVNALGQPYNVRQILDLARFLLPWKLMPRRWGSSLFRRPSGEPESGICSSLIAEAFNSVQFPILPFVKPDEGEGVEIFQRNPYLFTPKDFDYSPYFDIIKYPLFNPHEPLPYYRRMPWSKGDLIYQDHGILKAPKKTKGTNVKVEVKDDPKKNENQ